MGGLSFGDLVIRDLGECGEVEKGQFEKRFREVVEPIYGNQDVFLRKILEGKDRGARVLFDDGEMVGLLVFKKGLSDEREAYGIREAMEVKTFLIFSDSIKWKGLHSAFLFRDGVEEALKREAKSLFATLSEKKDEHMGFFEAIGFEEVARLPNLHEEGVHEKLLCIRNLRKSLETLNTFINNCEKNYAKRREGAFR